MTNSQARRIACAAAGFDRPRPSSQPDIRHFRRLLNGLGVVQLDFVNVLMPAQQLVVWSRLGAYDLSRLHAFAYARGEFTEQWAHEASIVPVRFWSLLEHRRKAHQLHRNNPLHGVPRHRAYLDAVLKQVADSGPLTAADLPPIPGPRRRPGDWHRPISRHALDFHFARGSLAVARRLANFQRVYDLPERVLPESMLACRATTAEAHRALLATAAGGMGIATLADLADYYRMPVRAARPRVAELVEDGSLIEVGVEGWTVPGYLAASARCPRDIPGASLLSPFDPLVWYRPRAARLFGFDYRLEIYVPASLRKWGYYVLPFRVADRIMARVDLKADRVARKLCVKAVYLEADADKFECVPRLAAELTAIAEWLELDAVRVTASTPVARRLAQLAQ